MELAKSSGSGIFNTAVIVAALGYFVDVYDLVLFSMVRISSLRDMGLTEEQIASDGMNLHNWQMIGMLLGGIFWGILGDKKGRLSVLFASIITYSIANIANGFVMEMEILGFVTTMDAYAFWRFIAGFGLAGELGLGITLVSESLSKEKRGYGTMLVASIGVTGAIFAALASIYFHWTTTYIIGGIMGLALLVLRIGVFESGMFTGLKEKKVSQGNFFSLFSTWKIFSKYIKCILFGVPIWFVIGLLIMYGTLFFKTYHTIEGKDLDRVQSILVMVGYMGLVIGDLLSGTLSQFLRSRRKTLFIFLGMMMIFIAMYFIMLPYVELTGFYIICALLGVSCGYWAIFVTVAAEQFGTNIRATVATTVPNFVRGALVMITISFKYFTKVFESPISSAIVVAAFCIVIALGALYFLEETFGKDLDYHE